MAFSWTEPLLNTFDTAIRACQTPFTDNIYVLSPLMDRLMAKRVTKPGRVIQIPHKKSKSGTASWRDADDTFTYAKSDTIFAPVLNWSRIQNTDYVSGDDLELCHGDAEIVPLLSIALEGLQKDIKDQLGGALYTGTGTESPPKVTGLEAICHASNTYAGIDRSVAAYSEWRGQVTAIDAELSKEALDTALTTLQDLGEMPDLIMTTNTINANCVNTWATPRQMFIAKTNPQISFEGFNYRGIPVMTDPTMASGEMYLLNTKYLNIYTPESGQMFKIERFVDESVFYGIRMRIHETLQLVCREPKFQYRLTGISGCVP